MSSSRDVLNTMTRERLSRREEGEKAMHCRHQEQVSASGPGRTQNSLSRRDGVGGGREWPKESKKMMSSSRKSVNRSPCCCMVWDWSREGQDDGENGRRESLRRRDVQTPEELRDFIARRTTTTNPQADITEQITPGWNPSAANTVAKEVTSAGAPVGGVTAARGGGREGGRAGKDADQEEAAIHRFPPRPSDDNDQKKTRNFPLIILRGLASNFVRILLDSEALAIDPEFIEAHAWRRGYHQPARMRRSQKRGSMRISCWSYPEMIRGFRKTVLKEATFGVGEDGGNNKRGRGRVIGTVTDPSAPFDLNNNDWRDNIRPISDTEDVAAVFPRASFWKNGPVGVLLLDTPVWEEESGSAKGFPLRKARRKGRGAITEPYALKRNDKNEGSWDVCLAPGKEMSGFEDAVHDTLASWSDSKGEDEVEAARDVEESDILLMDALEETAYRKWLEFFEVLTPRQYRLVIDGTSLEWQVLQALEGNMTMARDQERQGQRQRRFFSRRATTTEADDILLSRITVSDWDGLIQRLRARVEILSTIPPLPDKQKRDYFTIQGRIPLLPPQRDDDDKRAPGGGGNQQEDTDNQRALDRVTYLGGILLPISIVSGVLSMNEDFEPGSPRFWVFWVAALPLTALTMMIIYADKLRRTEVWVQVVPEPNAAAAAGGGETGSAFGEGADDAEWYGGKEDEDTKLGGGGKGGGHGKKKRKQKQQSFMPHDNWGYRTSLERMHGIPTLPTAHNNTAPHIVETLTPVNMPEAVHYGGLVEGDDIVIDLSGATQHGQEPQTVTVESPPSPLPSATATPPPPLSSTPESGDEEYESESDEATEDEEEHYPLPQETRVRPPDIWKRKELGWGGAAMCILKMQKPNRRVEDGIPGR